MNTIFFGQLLVVCGTPDF